MMMKKIELGIFICLLLATAATSAIQVEIREVIDAQLVNLGC